MFEPHKLYYLNQLGIIPWVTRDAEEKPVRLIVLIPNALSDAAYSLFKKIMGYLGANAQTKIEPDDAPKGNYALLNMGVSPDLIDSKFGQSHRVDTVTLNDLLVRPLSKKKLFQDLSSLKQFSYLSHELVIQHED